MGKIVWEMSLDQAEAYYEVARRLENYEISQGEFAEEITKLPGYPLRRKLLPGENLIIRFRASRPMVSVPRGAVQ
jgi:hypothetical protein